MSQLPDHLLRLMRSGEQHLAAKRYDEAFADLQAVLRERAEHPGVLHNMGMVLGQMGRLDEAVAAFRRTIQLRPDFPECFNNLGVTLNHQKKPIEAIAAFAAAIQLRFEWADPHHNLANLFVASERFSDAAREFQEAARLNPKLAGIHNNLGTALFRCDRIDEAMAAYENAMRVSPGDALARVNLGRALLEKGRPVEAAELLREVLKSNTGEFDATIYNLGVALYMMGEYEAALECHDKIIARDPHRPNVHMNRAMTLQCLGRFEESFAAHRTSIEHKPDDADTHSCYSFSLLLRGDFERGWPEFEWRLGAKGFVSPFKSNPPPRWDGKPLNGRTILIYSEQGLGDTIQFIRYAPLVAAMGGRVICRRPVALARLFESIGGVSQWIGGGDPVPPCDVFSPMLSLPLALGTTLENIPGDVPYLHAPPALAASWKHKLDAVEAGPLRVGVVWQGNPGHKNDYNRSIPAAVFASLGGVKNVRFFSLQKAVKPNVVTPPPGMDMLDFTNDCTDFADTAALIANLDLVISVDTSVAHLAGAMGKPVWTLVPFGPDWRWLVAREDSPWYPTMRLFRRPGPAVSAWADLLVRVRAELEQLAARR